MSIQQTTTTQTYIGRALEDLKTNSVSLKVLVPELAPGALTGTFAPGTTSVNTSLKTLDGTTVQRKVTTANHIVADWYGQRHYPYAPQIRAGEQVLIRQFSNSDKYFWEAMGRDRDLHQTDRHRIEVGAVSATQTSSLDNTKTDDNTYFFELDSVNKKLQLKTSKVNGEPFCWTFQFDTQAGTCVLSDDSGKIPNRFLIDAHKKQIQINNTSGTTITLRDKDIVVYAPQDILFKADRQIAFQTPTMTFNQQTQGNIVFNAQAITLNTKATNLNTSSFGVTAASTKIVGPVVMGPVRAQSFATGAVGSSYPSATSSITNGTSQSPAVSNDTDTSGAGDRHAAAYEQVSQALNIIAQDITKICQKIGLSIDVSPITTLATQCQISILMGQ